MKTFQELVEEAKKGIQEVSVEEVEAKRERGESFTFIDVREKEEYLEGYIEGAVHLSRGTLEGNIDKVVPQMDTPLIVYCAGGFRSALAARSLKEMGYQKVLSLAGGFGKWKRAGYPVVKDRRLTQEQLERYSRHILLTEVGEKGQGKLLDARVLLVGAGGLGSPAAYYLAAAGIGTLGIVDSDVVELSNLQRQILHKNSNIEKPKVLSAKETINALNPEVRVITFQDRLTAGNILEVIRDFDLIVDGSDNFPTRYLVNDACIMTGKPNVHGSIFQFEGQATVFHHKEGPCYRCLFPTPPPPGMVPG